MTVMYKRLFGETGSSGSLVLAGKTQLCDQRVDTMVSALTVSEYGVSKHVFMAPFVWRIVVLEPSIYSVL